MYVLLIFTLVTSNFAYSSGEAFGITNGTMFNILAMIPGVILCSFVRGYLFEKLRHAFGDNNGSVNPSKDPTQYLDPYGSICGIAFGFCWVKPVSYYPRHFKNPISNEIYIYIALSIANLAVGGFALSLYLLCLQYGSQLPHALFVVLSTVLIGTFKLNVMTALFSFVPVYGLPGYYLLIRHLDYKTVFKLQDYLSMTILIGILCLVFGASLFNPIISLIAGIALSVGVLPLIGICAIVSISLFFIQFKVIQKG